MKEYNKGEKKGMDQKKKKKKHIHKHLSIHMCTLLWNNLRVHFEPCPCVCGTYKQRKKIWKNIEYAKRFVYSEERRGIARDELVRSMRGS